MAIVTSQPQSTIPTRVLVEQWDRVFYTGMSAAIVLTVFVGFAPTYYLGPFFDAPALRPLVQLHALIFTAWVLLFFMQTALIATHRIRVHRRLGIAGACLAGVLIVVGVVSAVGQARRNFGETNEGALTFLAVPLVDMFVFGVLAASGLYYRRQKETHKRLMLLATINLLGAPIARWPLAIMAAGPVAFFGGTDLFVAASVLYDLWSRGRVHRAYVWGGLLLVLSQPLRLAMARTDTWLTFARALVQ